MEGTNLNPRQQEPARGSPSLWTMCHAGCQLKPGIKGQERNRPHFCSSNPTFLFLPHPQGYPSIRRMEAVPWVAQGTTNPPKFLPSMDTFQPRLLERNHSLGWIPQSTKYPTPLPLRKTQLVPCKDPSHPAGQFPILSQLPQAAFE